MKELSDSEILKKIIRYLNLSAKVITIVYVSFLVVSVIAFLRPLVIKSITDEGMIEKKLEVILLYSVLLLLLSIIEQLLEIFQSSIFIDIQNRLQKNLFEITFKKILHIKMGYFIKKILQK